MAGLAIPLIIGEYLAEIGLLGTEALTEAGLSEGAAGFVSKTSLGAGVGFLGSEINEVILDAIGNEKVQEAKKSFSELIQEAQGVASSDPAFFLKKRKEEKEAEAKAHNVKKLLDFNEDNSHLIIDQNEDIIKPQTINFDVPRGDQVSNSPNIQTTNTNIKYDMKDLIHFMTDYSSGIVQQALTQEKINKEEVLNNTILKNPTKYTDIANSLGSFLGSKIPANDNYIKIAEVYNGFGLEIDKVNMAFDPNKKLLYFTFFDETGEELLLYQSSGLVIPSVPGTIFMGANSPNNAMPGSKMPPGETGYTDLYSMYHDNSYINGPSLKGDYQYISRLTQNYNRMTNYDQKLAKIGILYFSTMGSIISRIANNDIADIEVGAYELVHQQETLGAFDKKDERIPSKEQFYEDFNKELAVIGSQKLANLNDALVISEIADPSVELL